MIYWPNKTTEDVVDLGINWEPFLSTLGDPTITGSSWSLIQGHVIYSAATFGLKRTDVRLHAGSVGEHILSNHITLSDGQQFSKRAFIKIVSV